LGGKQIVLSFLGSAYGAAGRREDALAVIDELLKIREHHFTAAFNIARVYGGLDETDKALEWLEKAIAERNGELVYFDVVTRISDGLLWEEELFEDSRFQNLLRRINVNASQP
jgi:tetratricopeptide (TPR) repeat protein